MRIQVNGRYTVQRLTGQQRYAHEIVARLGERVEVIAPRGPGKGVRGHLWEQAVLPWRLKRGLLWSPSATGPLAVRAQVVTIHDCAFCDHPQGYSRLFSRWYQCLVPRLARRVRKIITVSQFSKSRIVEVCGVSPDKVAVVGCGVDPRFRPHSAEELAALRTRISLPARYALCVGSLEPRKNLRRLLQAWERAQPQLDGLSLVLVGAPGHVFRDAGLSSPPPAVHLAGYLADDLLPAVYAGAESFIYPSLYEGFGLPVIEAMASGVPVATSNCTSLAEVAGDAAELVDPLEIDEISAAIVRLTTDALLRKHLQARGLIRAAQFNWDLSAEATWLVLQEAL